MMYNFVYLYLYIYDPLIKNTEVFMLNNNAMRPAFASVGAPEPSGRESGNRNFVAFSASADDDFNAFGDTSPKKQPAPERPKQQKSQQPPRKPQRRRQSVDPKMLLIGAAVLVAIILVVALFIAVFSSPGKDIERENNAYMVYTDLDGLYHVMANGKEIKETFEGEITLVPAKDNSFAYIFEEIVTEEGNTVYLMYILKGKKLSLVEAEADKIITYADYEPGIIFKMGSIVQLYSENSFEDISSDSSASNFLISGDATTVVYTEKSGRDGDQTQIKYFRNAGFNDIGETEGLTPAAISIDGKYVYAYTEQNALYYIEVTGSGTKFKEHSIIGANSYSFVAITDMNADGSEILFNYEFNGRIACFIYRVGDKKETQIGEGKFVYSPSERDVVAPATFVGSYLTATRTTTDEDGRTTTVNSTYLYDGGKGARKVADALGQFSPDGKYFYYIDSANADLVRVKLSSKDFEADSKVITKAVDSFVVTEKGDLYQYSKPTSSSGGKITFKKASDTTSRSISSKPISGSMFICGNTLYFAEGANDEIKLFSSSNGATQEEVTFKNIAFGSTLTVEVNGTGAGYAYFVDADGNTVLLYTEDGEDFDVVAESCIIPGYDTGIAPPTPEEPENTDEEE